MFWIWLVIWLIKWKHVFRTNILWYGLTFYDTFYDTKLCIERKSEKCLKCKEGVSLAAGTIDLQCGIRYYKCGWPDFPGICVTDFSQVLYVYFENWMETLVIYSR